LLQQKSFEPIRLRWALLTIEIQHAWGDFSHIIFKKIVFSIDIRLGTLNELLGRTESTRPPTTARATSLFNEWSRWAFRYVVIVL
jgi:hypothetical protein